MARRFKDSLGEIAWMPRPRLTSLRRLGLETVEDLLRHYPRRHEDRHQFVGFPREESEQPICLCGEVTKTRTLRFGGWKKIFEVTLEETGAHALSQPLVLRWFNLHYVQKMIVTGQQLVVFGKPRLRGKRLCMEHPEFEIIENDEEISIHFRRIAPIYPATEGLSQRVLRGLIHRLLEDFNGTDEAETLREIHFPKSFESLAAAREKLVYEEFFALQMLIAARRVRSRGRQGEAHRGAGRLLERFLRSLPFALTSAQLRVTAEIESDLGSPLPMNRLLQGDVGSGKTVVAIAAMLLAVEAGYQAALMAPTQILAEQHYAVLQRWLEPLGVGVSLRTGARKEDPLPLFGHAANSATPGRTGCHPVVPESFSGTDASQTRYAKRHLPHFERPWAKYAVTFSSFKKRLLGEEARDIVLGSLLYWNQRRYELYAACVMPNHVHVLLEPAIKENSAEGAIFFSLGEIFQSIKANTARKINKAAGTSGKVWEEEWYDRLIRSERDLQEKFHYITRNPLDAGLEEDAPYPWVWFPGISQDNSAPERRADCTPRRSDTPSSPEETSPRLAQIFVGTHALLFEPEGLQNPGLVVIDEQHKFGVAQRARLTTTEPAPDVLVMTATPIPRTLTMTLYGDLDVSTIDEMPADRGRIVTAARDESKLPDVLSFLRRELETGRQAYIVYPLIDESEKLEAKAASAEFEKWRERLQPFACELLHGRIPAPEKQATMDRFRHGLTSVLVSTTVIEVGVDVPNATVMLIENAERFGLAQLHQLRGRIGRGVHKSYCVLLSSDPSPETLAKLQVLEKTSNGFEVAEADWEMRGPGDLLGTAQSGLLGLKLGNLRSDAKLMERARAAVQRILRDDPELARPENQHFRALVVEEENFSHVS